MHQHSTLSAAVLFASLLAASQAHAGTCVPVSGKITNNFAAADGSQTLGVVAMSYGSKRDIKELKCALHGVQIPGDAAINYLHSISCDDTLDVPLGNTGATVPVHSSIVLQTTGFTLPPRTPTQLFTFQETSVPYLGAPARGLFAGVTGGQISVTGAVYVAPDGQSAGSIDMDFSGKVCY